jgi:uncharacterized membrane protein
MRRKILRKLCLTAACILILSSALIEFGNVFKIINKAYAQAGPIIRVEPLNETLSSNIVNNVALMVKNEGEGDALSITLQITPLNTYLTIVGSNVYTIEKLGPNESREITVKIYVPKSVSGATALRVGAIFMDESLHSQEVVYNLGFIITGNVEFALQRSCQTPSKVFPGDLNIILTAIIVNTGNEEATHLNATLKLPEGIKPSWAKSDNVYVGNAFPDTPMECKFYLDIEESTPPGLYNLELELVHDDGKSSLTVPLLISEKANFRIVDLNISPREIHPGDRGIKIQVRIKNSGNVEAKEVVIKLVGSSFSGMTTSFLGVLNPNDEAKAIFDVDVSELATTGENLLQFQISWTQEGRSLTQNIFYKIQISPSNPYFYVYFLAPTIIAIVIVAYLAKRLSERK